MGVARGDRGKLAFAATYPDGTLFDTSSREVPVEHDVDIDKRVRPIVLEIGAEPAIASLQDGLIGLEEGDTKRIDVPHEELRLAYDRDEFETMIGGQTGRGWRSTR